MPIAPKITSGRLPSNCGWLVAMLKNNKQGSARLNTSLVAPSIKRSSIKRQWRSNMPSNIINRLGTVTLNAKLQVSQDMMFLQANGGNSQIIKRFRSNKKGAR
ncbi:hypothetical protein D3C81_1428170 [compost metagenome]